MFDCGEGTQLQLSKSRLGWARLKAVVITHLHGDHVIGLSGLLMTMSMGSREPPLLIYGPPGIKDFVRLSQKYLKYGVAYPVEVIESEGGTLIEEEEYILETIPLQHRVFTLGCRLLEKPRPGRFDLEKARELEIPSGPLYKALQSGKEIELESGRVVKPEEVLGPPRPGRKFVYLVDTRPFPEEVEFARGADLLVHDGMFDDELAREGKDRGHSTAREAAGVAKKAGVKRLVLVHISPRYQTIQNMLAEARSVFPDTRVARDLDVYEIPYREEDGQR